MHPALQTLFERHVASSFDKQLFLASLIGDLRWRFDLDAGTITFGDRYTWPVQVLGIVSEQAGTWLWAWAITATPVPPGVLKVAGAMRRLGEARGIPWLTDTELPGGDATGTMLSMVASGVFRANAFFRAPYPGAAAFLLIAAPDFPANPEPPAARIPGAFPQAMARFGAGYALDHRRALLGYLRDCGLGGEPENGDLIVRNGAGNVLRARFDPGGKLAGIHGDGV